MLSGSLNLLERGVDTADRSLLEVGLTRTEVCTA